jgi:site-specific recombinase XerD
MFKDAFAQTNLEQTTLNAYTTSFITFIKHNNYKHPQTITDQEIRNFIVTISQKEQISKSSVNN